MDEIQLLIDFHKDAARQGPGSDEATAMAIDLAAIDRSAPLKIADIGCGTGASTLALARALEAEITAVDFLHNFLDVLKARSQSEGLDEKIIALCCSMETLPFTDGKFDVIWSEGAIYNIGFERGVADWRRFLKPGGLLIASELTWTTKTRPVQLQKHWESEYPEIDTSSAKMSILEENGYAPIGYFVLPENCWRENYYEPMVARFEDFLNRNGHCEQALELVDAVRQEIELFERYKAYYNYGVYIAKKL